MCNGLLFIIAAWLIIANSDSCGCGCARENDCDWGCARNNGCGCGHTNHRQCRENGCGCENHGCASAVNNCDNVRVVGSCGC